MAADPMVGRLEEPGPKGPGSSRVSAPDDNPKTAFGIRKPSLHAIPPIALLMLGQAMTEGERKYGGFNWREKRISASVYFDAAMRHLLSWWDGEDIDPDSGLPHPVKAMACLAIVIDGMEQENLNDDRPKVRGRASEYIMECVDEGRGMIQFLAAGPEVGGPRNEP